MDYFRNIGIFAHIDAGKTTLVERILYEARIIASLGSIEDGTTEMDKLPQEIKRGISILSSTVLFEYKYNQKYYKINIIDTPGHIDFHTQVDASLLAIDLAILLIDITAGIRSQTELILDKLQKEDIPYIVFINKTDIISTMDILKEIASHFQSKLNSLCKKEKDKFSYVFHNGFEDEEICLPLIEWNSALSDMYLNSIEDIQKLALDGLVKGFEQRKFIPVFFGSALLGIGIVELLNFLCMISFHRSMPKRKMAGVVFAHQNHHDMGKIGYIKTYKKIQKDQEYFVQGNKLSFSNLYIIKLDESILVDSVHSHSVFATDFIENLEIGEGIYDGEVDKYINLFTPPLRQFSVVIEPISEEFREKLISGLDKITWEDKGLELALDTDTGQSVLYGCGELHIDVSVERLKEFVGEIFSIGKLKVARYEMLKSMSLRETFEHSIHDKSLKSGRIDVLVEKILDEYRLVQFDVNLSEIVHTSIVSAFHEALSHGNFGNEVFGLKLKVLSYQEPDIFSHITPSLIKVAVISGIRSILKDNTIEIGPLSQFEIIIPDEYIGLTLGYLQKRSSKIISITKTTMYKSFIKGEASTENLLGFASALRNMTKGKGFVSLNTIFGIDKYSIVSVKQE